MIDEIGAPGRSGGLGLFRADTPNLLAGVLRFADEVDLSDAVGDVFADRFGEFGADLFQLSEELQPPLGCPFDSAAGFAHVAIVPQFRAPHNVAYRLDIAT